MPLRKRRNESVWLWRCKTVAVDHVDFDFHEGEFVSIVGESGSGKTTLSKMLLGLISVTEGEIDLWVNQETSRTERRKRVLEGNSGDFPGSVCFLQYV